MEIPINVLASIFTIGTEVEFAYLPWMRVAVIGIYKKGQHRLVQLVAYLFSNVFYYSSRDTVFDKESKEK